MCKIKSIYRGRFAPSPTGPLHLGSLVAAMASYLDALAHNGEWYLRIEDIDTPRVVKDADSIIMRQLESFGMQWHGDVIWQSQRIKRYEEVFNFLHEKKLIYGCSCTRKEASHDSTSHRYMGTCKNGTDKPIRSWRLIMPDTEQIFYDRWFGKCTQNVAQEVGDIIIKRADGLFAYQLVVVVDDIEQGINNIVRGEDLLDSTCRQICITNYLINMKLCNASIYRDVNYVETAQRNSGVSYNTNIFRYLHVPLVLDENGNKLSKQNHAPALDSNKNNVCKYLLEAWKHLGFEVFECYSKQEFWQIAKEKWATKFLIS